MSINVELNTKEVNIIVYQNILKMLKRRNVLDDEITFEKIKNDINNKAFIDFPLLDESMCSIYIINGKLNSIVQGSQLDDYLSNNINVHKIVIIREIAKKVFKQINYEYKNAEFFFEYEMMEDLPLNVLIPEHQLLNNDEKNELLQKFNENDLSIIYSTDVMARYYHAMPGDIFRIIRPSITSGKSIFYRRVNHNNIDLLFNINKSTKK